MNIQNSTKFLTQAVFDDMPKWVKSARIDKKRKVSCLQPREVFSHQNFKQ